MLYYLCVKADLIRMGLLSIAMIIGIVCLELVVVSYPKEISKLQCVAAGAGALMCGILYVFIPDSYLAFELCRRAGITF